MGGQIFSLNTKVSLLLFPLADGVTRASTLSNSPDLVTRRLGQDIRHRHQ